MWVLGVCNGLWATFLIDLLNACNLNKEPIFRNYFISISDILASRIKAHERSTLNSNDKGELCESFIQDFLVDAMGNLFTIYRGGKIVNAKNQFSNQLDIILCRKRTLKLFGDKGLYPIESIMASIEITATLTEEKLMKDCSKLLSIPKKDYNFHMSAHLSEGFRKESLKVYQIMLPLTGIFGYRGDIKPDWVNVLNKLLNEADQVGKSLMPMFVAVNKSGFIFKKITPVEKKVTVEYLYMDFSHPDLHGETFGRILNMLYNISQEEINMQFDYTHYFNADIEDFLIE